MIYRTRNTIYFMLIWLCIFSISCIQEVEPYVESDRNLVITSSFTNVPGKHSVRVFFTTDFNERLEFVSDAIVRIEAGDGTILDYEYNNYGYYYLCEPASGIPGQTYKLSVILGDNTHYESTVDTLYLPPPITTIEHQLNQTEIGSLVDFNISYSDDLNTRNYYRWNYLGTYQVEAPLPRELTYRYCWAKQFDHEIILVDQDLFYDGRTVEHKPLFSIPLDRKFNIGFDMQIIQKRVSKDTYRYWNAVDNQRKNKGSIFEKANYQIRGNITNVDNPEELVLGYFEVAGVQTKRIFIDEYAGKWGPVICSDCSCKCWDCHYFGSQATNKVPDFWPYNPYGEERILRKSFCSNCRFTPEGA